MNLDKRIKNITNSTINLLKIVCKVLDKNEIKYHLAHKTLLRSNESIDGIFSEAYLVINIRERKNAINLLRNTLSDNQFYVGIRNENLSTNMPYFSVINKKSFISSLEKNKYYDFMNYTRVNIITAFSSGSNGLLNRMKRNQESLFLIENKTTKSFRNIFKSFYASSFEKTIEKLAKKSDNDLVSYIIDNKIFIINTTLDSHTLVPIGKTLFKAPKNFQDVSNYIKDKVSNDERIIDIFCEKSKVQKIDNNSSNELLSISVSKKNIELIFIGNTTEYNVLNNKKTLTKNKTNFKAYAENYKDISLISIPNNFHDSNISFTKNIIQSDIYKNSFNKKYSSFIFEDFNYKIKIKDNMIEIKKFNWFK